MDQAVQNTQGTSKWLILLSIMIGTFMAVLDATIVNTALPVIMGSLGASINKAEWILTAYMLSLAAILPAAAWLANRFGYKKMYILSVVIFTFGSFMCGNSSTIGELVFWRVIEGFGCGSIMPVGMAIITNAFPPQQRGVALGFWSISSAASVSFGPAIGGYLVDAISWNSVFYVNVPVGVLCIFLAIILLYEYKLPTKQRFDLPGFLTSSLFLTLFMYGLTEVNSSTNPQGWSSPIVMGCLWASALLFMLFIYFELTTEQPLINLRIFRNRNFAWSNIILFIFGIGMFGSTFLIPLYLQDNLGYSALQSGLFFIPVGIIQAICSPIAGSLSRRINPGYLIALGLLLMSTSFYMNSYLSYLTDRSYIAWSIIIRGMGMGILFTPLLAVSINNMKGEWIAEASSITNIIRQMGGSFGVALLSHILTNRTTFHTQVYGESISTNSVAFQHVVTNLADSYQKTSGMTLQQGKDIAEQMLLKHLDMEAYIAGINDDFIIALVFSLSCLIPVLFLRRINKKAVTR